MEFLKAFGNKTSPYKVRPLNSSSAALQKLKAAFKLSVICQDCSDAVWHSLLVGFAAEACSYQVVGASSGHVGSEH